MEIISTTAKNTTITMDVETEIIPASTLAKVFNTSTSADRAREFARKTAIAKEDLEKNLMKKINTALLKNETCWIELCDEDCSTVLPPYVIVEVCEKIKKKFEKSGYSVGGHGTYSASYYKIYQFYVHL